MHCRSERLSPARGCVAFVQPGQWLAAAKDVKERTDHAGIRGHQHESHFIIGDSGVARISTATNSSDAAASTNQSSITPSNIEPSLFLVEQSEDEDREMINPHCHDHSDRYRRHVHYHERAFTRLPPLGAVPTFGGCCAA